MAPMLWLSAQTELPQYPLDADEWEVLFAAAENHPPAVREWLQELRQEQGKDLESAAEEPMLGILEAYSGIYLGEAAASLEQSLEIAESLRGGEEPIVYGRALQVAASAAFLTRDYERAAAIGKEVLNISESLVEAVDQGDADYVALQRMRASAHSIIGNIHTMRTEFVQASEAYLEGLRELEAIDDETRASKLRVNLANVSMMAGDLDAARRNFEDALAFAERTGNVQIRIVTLTNLGPIYEQLGEVEKEYTAYTEALQLVRERGLESMVPTLLINLSDYYLRQENWQQAMDLASEAMELSDASGDTSTLGVAHVNFGLALLGMDAANANQALEQFRAAEKIFEDQGADYQLSELYSIFADAMEGAGEYAQALGFHRRFKEVSDQITSTDTSERLAALRAQYDEERREREVAELRQANVEKRFALEKQEIQNAYQEGLLQMQNAQLRRERMLRNLLVGALLVLVLAVGLLLAKMRSERAAKARAEQLNRELTEREQALHRANDDLRRAIAEKDDLLGVVSHDLKNPIGAIQGIADLLQEDMPKGASEDFREMVGMVRTTAERMFAVVSDLLDSYRSGSASSERNRATVDLVEICHASASMWTKRIAEKQQTLHLDLPDHPLPFVGDPTSLHQIVDNLLSNAIKYTPLGKELGVRLSVVDTMVRLEVWDQGPGIPEDEQPLLFQKFAKVSNQPTGGEHSSGLGLSIVKRRVEDLGGTVRCESEPGQGSRFIVELPLIAP